MKKNLLVPALLVCMIGFTSVAFSQAFRKGTLMIGISEGSTKAFYSTNSIISDGSSSVKPKCQDGIRDPFVIEYGISDRWSFGLCSGNDIFKVNIADYYGGPQLSSLATVTTNEFTFDANYHFYVNKRLDLSAFTSLGGFSIKIKGNENDISYKHESSGNIVRVGVRARYYFWKRLGAFGMISNYTAHSSPKTAKGNSFGSNYETTLSGFAIEAGLCFRILR